MPRETDAGENGNELIERRGGAYRQQQPDHCTASSATPQAINPAPAQRRMSTFSLSNRRARIVSSTKLAAVAGTAKLKSATVSSLMNAKNDSAMQRMVRIRKGRPSSLAYIRPSFPGRKSDTSP